MPPEISASRRRIAGVGTHVLSGGAGEPIVFLHGLGASSFSWRHLLPEFAKTHSVYAPDFPGYGRSDKPRDFDYTFAGFARWLSAFLKELDLPRAALVGNSMGGDVSLFLALQSPELVSRFVMIGSPVNQDNIPRLIWTMRRPFVGRILEPLLGRWTVRLVAPTAFHDRSCITEEVLDEYSLALSTPEGRHAAAENIRRCLSPELADYIARYPKLEPPVLFIRGEHDRVVDDASAEWFCRTVPKGRFLRIPDCGHVPQEERPEAVAAAIREFLASPGKP
ncbi:MAG: alpha/beta hydrolase [Elusimicrobia bacterium]|nr:alpha/beta hydrolase [Elusimicrobiota bacterium]